MSAMGCCVCDDESVRNKVRQRVTRDDDFSYCSLMLQASALIL